MTNQDFETLSMIARIEFPLNHFCKHYSCQLYHINGGQENIFEL